jgi:hypothetical protein
MDKRQEQGGYLMNLLDAVVKKVLSEPKFVEYNGYQWWEIEVEYDCYGALSKTKLTFKTKEEAEKVKVGYKFLV